MAGMETLPPQAPEHAPEAPEKDPAQLFAEHVELVREHGDALDAQRYLWLKPPIKAGAIIGVTAGLAAESTIGYGDTLNPTINAGVIATAGLWATAKFWRARRDRAEGLKRFSSNTQVAVGERYELYGVNVGRRVQKEIGGKHLVHMRWYGPMPDKEKPPVEGDGLEHLVYVATMAKTQGVSRVIIGDDIIKNIAKEPVATKDTMANYLRLKGLATRGRSKQDLIHSKSPEEWLQFVADERAAKGYSLEGLLARIEGHQYDHPLARIKREFSMIGPQRNDKLLNAARMGVERQLDGAQRGWDAYGAPIKVHTRGTLLGDGKHVMQYGNGRFIATTGLHNALGMTDEQLLAMAEKGDTDPHRALQALEVLAYKKLKQQEANVPTEKDGSLAELATSGVSSYQVELIRPRPKNNTPEKTKLTGQRYGRAWRFVVAAAVFGAGAPMGSNYLGEQYTERMLAQHEALVKERGVEHIDVEYDDPELEKRMGPWQLWGKTSDIITDAAYTLDHGPFHLDGWTPPTDYNPLNPRSAASVGDQSRMGNVKQTPNRVDWYVSGTNAETDGYWANWVANDLDTGELAAREDGLYVFWANEDRGQELTQLNLPAELPAGITSYITVKRNLSATDFSYPNNTPDLAILQVPVREGTRPVAGNLNGKPVQFVERADGTFYVQLTDDEKPTNVSGGNFEYWLTEAPEQKPPHAVDQLDTSLTIDSDMYALDAAWDKIIPSLPQATGDPVKDEKRSRMIAAYMGDHWSYKLSPWPDGLMRGVTTYEEMAIRAAQARAANCNVANTLIALENPNLRPTFGYMNSSDAKGKSMLSANESHQWLTNQEGEIIDGTPSGGMSAEDAAHFSEDYSKPEQQPGNSTWLYGQLTLLAAGVAVWRRRNIAKAALVTQKGVAKVNERQLASIPVADLALVTNLMEQVNYAPKVDVAAARNRAARTTATAEQLNQRLTRKQSGLHTKAGEQALRTAAKQSSGQDRTDLRRSARIARRARRVANHRR